MVLKRIMRFSFDSAMSRP